MWKSLDTTVEIPMDIYESNNEIVVLIPIWWVKKESLDITLEKTKLTIKWTRECPKIKENLMPLQQDCFWWDFWKTIELPPNVFFDQIHTKLTTDNVLILVIPKVIIPDKVKLDITVL